MTYDELVQAVSGATGIEEETIRTVIGKVSDVVLDCLTQIESVNVEGLALFRVECEKYKGRDQYGRPMTFIRRRYVDVTPSAKLREPIDKNYPPYTTKESVYCECHHC